MRFFGLCSALVCLTLAVSLAGCLGGDDTSVAPPAAVDAGPDATTDDAGTVEGDDSGTAPEDAGSSSDGGSADANPFR